MKSIKKNATLNIVKTICNVLFPMITFPYVSRTLGTEAYGQYSFASSIISYISLLSIFGLTNYATREGAKRRDKDIGNFVNEVYSINIVTTIIAYIVLIILLIFWNKLKVYSAIILILGTSVIFTTIGTDWINVIYEDYAYLTKRYIACYIMQIAFMFALVHTQSDINIYAAVSIFSSVVSNIMNVVYIRRRYNIHPHIQINRTIIKHICPALVFFASSIVSIIYINSDITILGSLRTDYDVGIYTVASRIYSLVKQIINAVTAVIIPRMAVLIAQNEKIKIRHLINKTLNTVLLIVLPSVTGLICLSKTIVLIISGASYYDAHTPLEILAFALVFAPMANIFLNAILIPYMKEKEVLIISTCSALLNIILNFIFIPRYGYNAAAFTTLISEMIGAISGILCSRKLVILDYRKSIMVGLQGSALVIISWKISMNVTNEILSLLITILLSVVLYGLILFIWKENVFYETIYTIVSRFKSSCDNKKRKM